MRRGHERGGERQVAPVAVEPVPRHLLHEGGGPEHRGGSLRTVQVVLDLGADVAGQAVMVRSRRGVEDDVTDAGLRRRVDEIAAVAKPLGRAGVRILEDEDERAGATQGALQRGRIVEPRRSRAGHVPARVAPPRVALVEQRVRLGAERTQMAEGGPSLMPRRADDVDRARRSGHGAHRLRAHGTVSDTGVVPGNGELRGVDRPAGSQRERRGGLRRAGRPPARGARRTGRGRAPRDSRRARE